MLFIVSGINKVCSIYVFLFFLLELKQTLCLPFVMSQRGMDTFPTLQKLLWCLVGPLGPPCGHYYFCLLPECDFNFQVFSRAGCKQRAKYATYWGSVEYFTFTCEFWDEKQPSGETPLCDRHTPSPLRVELLCNFHRLFGVYSKFARCQFLQFLKMRKKRATVLYSEEQGRFK